jgi:hypothetical protein
MTSSADRFYRRAKSHIARERDIPDYFVYHLTVELAQPMATTAAIKECYHACDLTPPTWLGPHLSNGLSSRPRLFRRVDGGYRLEARRRNEIAEKLGNATNEPRASPTLDALEVLIPVGPKRDFLHETILCYGAGANRATIVMCWNLALHHLQDHVMADAQRLGDFNVALGKNTDGRVKIKKVTKQDDFTEMPESKFLLFCREAKLISVSVYNKLETCLDQRNAAAHPSGTVVTPTMAEAYVEDLVQNVVRKYAA